MNTNIYSCEVCALDRPSTTAPNNTTIGRNTKGGQHLEFYQFAHSETQIYVFLFISIMNASSPWGWGGGGGCNL